MFKTKRQKTMSAIVCGVYIYLLIWLILFKFNINFADLDHMKNINLIPFQESLIVNGRIDLKEIIYNILVFVPLGVYVSMFKSNWPFGKKIIPALCLSIIFEMTQYILAIGASDITDIIGNTLGGIAGIACYILLEKIFKNKCITIINTLGLAVEILAVVMLAVLLLANM